MLILPQILPAGKIFVDEKEPKRKVLVHWLIVTDAGTRRTSPVRVKTNYG